MAELWTHSVFLFASLRALTGALWPTGREFLSDIEKMREMEEHTRMET